MRRPDVNEIRRRCSAELGRTLAYFERGDIGKARAAAAGLIEELAAAGLIDAGGGET